MSTERYEEEYAEFIASLEAGNVGGEEVGIKIARFAQYFATYNLQMVALQFEMGKVAAEIESSVDGNGKTISSTKAQVLVDATEESNKYRTARAHMQNCEQFINALKSLQKGILNEYAHQGT